MPNEINLHLYQGNGETLRQRNGQTPKFQPIADADAPENYIAERGLRDAVNVALALGQPLLVTGEPGCGKTQLAASIAYELGLPLLTFFTKTTSIAADLFYQYDALRRFQDAHFTENRSAADAEAYITYQALGQAILLAQPPEQARGLLPPDVQAAPPTRSVVLIDEIDKAPRDLPNDVLNEIEQMEFRVKETGRVFKAEPQYRPIVVLTSNSEKNLPDAFLRRCVFYHIPFPSAEQLAAIIRKRFGDASDFTPEFITHAVTHFEEIRKLTLNKKPATAELLAWIPVLWALGLDPQYPKPEQADTLAVTYSILAKTEHDLALLRRQFAR